MHIIEMDRSFLTIFITHMFIEVFLLTQATLIPVYVLEFNLSLFEASFVVTAQSIMGLLMNFPAGLLADRLSARRMLFISMIIEGVSAIFLSQTSDFWSLLICIAVMKASSPLYHTSGLSRISKNAERDQISRSMGFHNAFGSIGSTIGAISLSVFLSTIGWRWAYLFWSIPILAWGLILYRSPQLEEITVRGKMKSQGGKKIRWSKIFSTELLIFLTVIGVRAVGITGISTFMTTYLVNLRQVTESTASLIFGLGPVIGVFGSLNGGYLGEKKGAKKALTFSIVGCVVTIIALAISSHLFLLATIYVLYEFMNHSAYTPMNTMIANTVPATERGVGFSAFFFTMGLVQSITPMLTAILIQAYGVWYIFPFSIIFIVASQFILQALHYPEGNTE